MRIGAAIAGAILLTSVAQAALAADNAEEALPFRDVTDAALKAKAMRTLNGSLQLIGRDAKIRNCSILLWSHPGRLETVYSGMCELETGHTVVICGDTGIGEFGVGESFSPTKDGVAEFARNNCPGG